MLTLTSNCVSSRLSSQYEQEGRPREDIAPRELMAAYRPASYELTAEHSWGVGAKKSAAAPCTKRSRRMFNADKRALADRSYRP